MAVGNDTSPENEDVGNQLLVSENPSSPLPDPPLPESSSPPLPEIPSPPQPEIPSPVDTHLGEIVNGAWAEAHAGTA